MKLEKRIRGLFEGALNDNLKTWQMIEMRYGLDKKIAAAQRADSNLTKCIDAAVDQSQISKRRVGYFWDVAKADLAGVQSKMKTRYDKKIVVRSFEPGDSVLVVLPVPGSVMQAKFSGPYVIDKKLSDTNYVIYTPDRRRKSRMCHINMLKAYVSRDKAKPVVLVKPVSENAVFNCPYSPEADG